MSAIWVEAMRVATFTVALFSALGAQAADTVIVGTVGSASTNQWPLQIGIEKGFFAGKVVEGEKPVDHRSADFRFHFRIGKNCFDLGSKHDGVPRLRVIQGLNSDAIAGEKE